MATTMVQWPCDGVKLLGATGASAQGAGQWFAMPSGAKVIEIFTLPETSDALKLVWTVQLAMHSSVSGAKSKNNPETVISKTGADGAESMKFSTLCTLIRVNVTTYNADALHSQVLMAADYGTIVTLDDAEITVGDVTIGSNITETNSTAIKAAVEKMDDWDEADRAKVNPIVGQAGIDADAGAASAKTPRVITASDDPGNVHLGTIAATNSLMEGHLGNIATDTASISTDASTIAGAIGTEDGTLPSGIALIGGEVVDGVPTEVTDGNLAALWINTFKQLVPAGFDLTQNALSITEVAPPLLMLDKETGITQLTEPGVTTPVDASLYGIAGYSVTIANIDSNVILGLVGTTDESGSYECRLVNTAVANCAISGNRATITANGTYLIYTEDPAVKLQLDWISELGGANATADADRFFRRK